MAETAEQRSSLRDFLGSIATIKGDLSNITAPPFVLADRSTTEYPLFWIDHPSLYVAPTREPTPELRMLAILKWFLSSLKSQQYGGRDPKSGIKKPLNAFLGEVFLGETSSESEGVTHLISEQVSHHPPVTACYLFNEQHGVRAEGFTRQEITFNGSVNIAQIGHAVVHLDEHDEDYLIPLPNVRVQGVVTGSPYPEIHGHYEIVSSKGWVATLDFSGTTFLGFRGSKHHVEATVHRVGEDVKKGAVFTVVGNWLESFEFRDREGKVVDRYDVAGATASEFRTAREVEEQDEWESRKAWKGVIQGLRSGNMQMVANEKKKIEDGQRALRKKAETSEQAWKPIFFRKEDKAPVAEKLLGGVGKKLDPTKTCGVWVFNKDSQPERPYRGKLTPRG